jgi:hypothetical protein
MANEEKKFDEVDFIINFEGGELKDKEELIAGFQHLINSGIVWRLQGLYGRTAQRLIDQGFCTLPSKN